MAECAAGEAPDANKVVCEFCEDGKFADHVNHLCGVDCPSGTTTNETTRNCDEDALSVVLGSAQHLDCADSEPYLSGAPVPSCASKCPIGQGANGTNYCVECVGKKPYADHASHR